MSSRVALVRERKTRVKKKRNRWLELIAAYKILQAVLLVAVGVGALRLIHKDLADMLTQFAIALHRDPEGQLVSFLIDKVSLLTDQRLRQIGLFMFFYAGLGLLEGIGLMMEKVWAEYLTALITASFLPIEIFELIHRVTPIRVGLLVVNLAVLAYLVAHLIRQKRAVWNTR